MKNILKAIAAAALLAVPFVAFAGERAVAPVEINTTWKYASGSLGSARNSVDPYQSIGCGVYAYTTSTPYVSCSARSAKPQNAYCYSYNPELVKVGLGISGDSGITFFWNDDGTCSSIQLYNGSNGEPKRP